jgi:dTDP-4-amino-4,6-dideoxygalactose transaminase
MTMSSAMTEANSSIGAHKRIPLVDVVARIDSLRPALDAAIAEVLRGGAFVGGAHVTRFETAFADFCGAPHCVGVANGTDALELTLRALGIGAGDEVVTVPMTFFATAEAIVNVGARPVFVDVDGETGLMQASGVAAAITPRTRAILPVHLYGQPCDMDELGAIARWHGLSLVGDGAQAHGASWQGRPIAAFGDATTFSFYPGKNLGAVGDGGAVVTHNQRLANEVRRLANHGRTEKYLHDAVGRNSRLDALQAAVLSVKLTRLDEWNRRRSLLAERYLNRLRTLPVRLPVTRQSAGHVWHLFTIGVDDRRPVQQALSAAGIETGIHYPVPLHLQPALRGEYGAAGAFPNSERISETTVSLPLYPELSEADQQRIVDAIAASFRH